MHDSNLVITYLSMSTYIHPGPPPITPEQRLLLMKDDSWESFIEESVRQLGKENNYYQVLRLGGAGDKGRDVASYTLKEPAAGTWDLYQAKYYEGTLSPTEFAGDLAKFLVHVFEGSYTRPRRYYICALRVGPKLHDYVLNPNNFKAWLLQQWEEKGGVFKGYTAPLTAELKGFVSSFPFDVFETMSAAALLEIHARSDKHWEQFGVLATREPNPETPELPASNEQVYIQALLHVYDEKLGVKITDLMQMTGWSKRHLAAQRKLFYCAEGLNKFSRDKLPGAFDSFVNEVHVGVGSQVTFPHADGLTRLQAVLETANSLQVNTNPLSARLQAGDLQGACHHIANTGLLTWIDKDE